jgi:hypothetical protein
MSNILSFNACIFKCLVKRVSGITTLKKFLMNVDNNFKSPFSTKIPLEIRAIYVLSCLVEKFRRERDGAHINQLV